MPMRGLTVAVLLSLVAFVSPCCAGFTATFTLGPSQESGNIANFDVSLIFTSPDDPNYVLTYLELDLTANAAALNPEGDYSRFSFTPNTAVLTVADWERDLSFPESSIVYVTPIAGPGGLPPVTSGAGLVPGSYFLGTLNYDMTGISPSVLTTALMSIQGRFTGVGVEIPDDPSTFEFVDATFNPGSQLLRSGTTQTPPAVPAPSSLILAGIGSLVVSFWKYRHRNRPDQTGARRDTR